MRLALIANPKSGRGLEPAQLSAWLESHGAEVVLCEEGWRGDEETRAVCRGTERIVAAGGDGIVGACAGLACELGLPLAVVPAGTANDFAAAHDLPTDPEAACRLAVTGTSSRALELAFLDGRPFVNAASAGLSPQAAEKAQPLKGALGPLAYAAGAVAAGVAGDGLACTVRVDGSEGFRGEAWQVILAATGAFGGGAEIDEADPGDGLLDVVILEQNSRLELPRRALAMRRGDLTDQDGVVHLRGSAVELDVPAGTPFNVDGELIEAGPRVTATARADAYRLVVPA